MTKIWGAFAALAAAVAAWWFLRGSQPPEVPFARATRERIESAVTTNGKLEPAEWTAVRAERDGLVERVRVARGEKVRAGQVIAEMEARDARADLVAAESRIAQIRAEIETLNRGGRPSELAENDAAQASARLEKRQAEEELAKLMRLESQRAATAVEVQAAKDRVARLDSQLAALAAKRRALVADADRSSARARLRDAEAAAALARAKIAMAAIASPRTGTVYQLDARPGAFLTPGALVANVGTIERLRALVMVDEPELGRVRVGLPVSFTWDAMPGRNWKGTVDKMPTQIVPLGTRQVGEVQCLIDNRDGALPAGANVNASILAQAVDNAIAIPKEALRREGSESGVYLLEGGAVKWRPVKVGLGSVTRIEVEGLKDGDAVALPSEVKLANGVAVTPKFQ
ncbi:MAG: efflux RND transporter periplasmic adaptor subunit [Bryobacteraceae bacterium]|nr:efflux RND transporter periplasmic adaptor subunit [Bryobacteraceae bacterium]